MTAPGKTPAWLVAWECGCSDVRTDPAQLPATCPGHQRPPIEAPEQLDVLNQYVDVHECDHGTPGSPPCAAAEVTA